MSFVFSHFQIVLFHLLLAFEHYAVDWFGNREFLDYFGWIWLFAYIALFWFLSGFFDFPRTWPDSSLSWVFDSHFFALNWSHPCLAIDTHGMELGLTISVSFVYALFLFLLSSVFFFCFGVVGVLSDRDNSSNKSSSISGRYYSDAPKGDSKENSGPIRIPQKAWSLYISFPITIG